MTSNNVAKLEEDDKQNVSKTSPTQKGTLNGATKEDGKNPAKKRRKVNHGQSVYRVSGEEDDY
jgi:hypothetical protein